MSLGSIKHYELLERIGVGAESSIYRAHDTQTGKTVAIKDIIVTARENHKYLGHVTNEYAILRALHADSSNDNGIVKAFQLIKSGLLRRQKRRSLVMEFVNGKDLRREKRYPLPQLLDIFRQTAATLRYMHGRGYVHGDLKPENIMVNPQGRAKIVDFGFACRAGTQAVSVRGTRDYMAPEQVNRGLITERTDIYNFGATMYYLVGGKHVPPLIAPANGGPIFIAADNDKLIPLGQLNPQTPLMVEQLIARCCEREPLRRPSTMIEVHDALTDICRQMPPT